MEEFPGDTGVDSISSIKQRADECRIKEKTDVYENVNRLIVRRFAAPTLIQSGSLVGLASTGGLVGHFGNFSTIECLTISKSYSKGTITSTSGTLGGLIGLSSSRTAGTGKTTAQMQSSSTFPNFDFTPTTGVWKMPPTTGFPMLIWH